MLSWTEAGAVQRPEILQIRVQRRYPDRVRAGAPEPGRSLTLAEILANLAHFTDGQRGPRSTPCTGLVLSGVGLLAHPDTPAILAAARALGMRRVVVHAGPEDLAGIEPGRWRGLVDTLVVPLRPAGSLPEVALGQAGVGACRHAGIRLSVNCVLDLATLAGLDPLIEGAARWEPEEFTFSFPFPGAIPADALQRPAVVLPALRSAAPVLRERGCMPRIKGLPACYLGDLAPLLASSSNRWYVDAEHQGASALLFFPGVLAFHKGEVCRFCARDSACDGFFAEWLRLPGFPPLEPVSGP